MLVKYSKDTNLKTGHTTVINVTVNGRPVTLEKLEQIKKTCIRVGTKIISTNYLHNSFRENFVVKADTEDDLTWQQLTSMELINQCSDLYYNTGDKVFENEIGVRVSPKDALKTVLESIGEDNYVKFGETVHHQKTYLIRSTLVYTDTCRLYLDDDQICIRD